MTGRPITMSSQESFEAYVKTHAAILFAYALARTQNRATAEDLVQCAFIKVWMAWERINEELPPGDDGIGYVLTVLHNINIDEFRKAKRRPKERAFDPLDHEKRASPTNIEVDILFAEFQREVWWAVATLSDVQQALIYLIYVEEYTISAAARTLGLARTTADRYHKFALSHLKQMLNVQEPDIEEDQIARR